MDENPDLKKKWTSLIPQGAMGKSNEGDGYHVFCC